MIPNDSRLILCFNFYILKSTNYQNHQKNHKKIVKKKIKIVKKKKLFPNRRFF